MKRITRTTIRWNSTLAVVVLAALALAVSPAAAAPGTTLLNTYPGTTLLSGPSGTVTTNSATFTFEATNGGVSLECRLDGSSWSGCSSPKASRA